MGLLSGLLGGSKSSSSSSTTTKQDIVNDTTSSDISNIASADAVISGKDVTYINNFGEEVQSTINNALDLVSKIFDESVSFNKNAIGQLHETSTQAIGAVSTRFEAAENPTLSLTRDLIPVLLIGSGLAVLVIFMRKK